jgi:hypothetical protein
MIFYDQNKTSSELTSNLHDFGHMFNIFHEKSSFQYIQFLLYLQSNTNFNIDKLFFSLSKFNLE